MKLLSQIPPVLKNKYFLAIASFFVWMLFFDQDDLFMQLERRRHLNDLIDSKEYFTKQIREDREFSNRLKTNAAAIEKFAREKYLMKRDNEEIFLIRKAENK